MGKGAPVFEFLSSPFGLVAVGLGVLAVAVLALCLWITTLDRRMRGMADEVACVASWLEQHAGRIRLERSEGTLASVLPRLPDVRPRISPRARRG